MRHVPGSGPVPSSVMFIAERPGREEDRTGIPLTGPSGRLFNSFLWQFLHLNRSDVYVTNLVHHFHESGADVPPTAKEIADDWPALLQEIEDCNPDFIVTLGRFATRAFMGDVDMEVVHGIPSLVGPRVILPSYHPAAGLHNTELSALVAYDFMQAAAVIRGEIEPVGVAEDEYPEPRYVSIDRHVPSQIVPGLAAVDTEGSISKPWCATWSQTPGTAACMRRGQMSFQHIVLHNAMHDIGVLRALDAEYESFDDTMVAAYLLCVEPQGLKPLARRHAGMIMSAYDEMVGPADRRLATEWLKLANATMSGSAAGGNGTVRKSTKSGAGGRKSAAKRLSGNMVASAGAAV